MPQSESAGQRSQPGSAISGAGWRVASQRKRRGSGKMAKAEALKSASGGSWRGQLACGESSVASMAAIKAAWRKYRSRKLHRKRASACVGESGGKRNESRRLKAKAIWQYQRKPAGE